MKVMKKSELSEAWKSLIVLCQRLNYGHIEGLAFERGEPAKMGPVVKTFRPGKDNAAVKQVVMSDFRLKQQWLDVIQLARSKEKVRVRKFEVAAGLPLKLYVEESEDA